MSQTWECAFKGSKYLRHFIVGLYTKISKLKDLMGRFLKNKMSSQTWSDVKIVERISKISKVFRMNNNLK